MKLRIKGNSLRLRLTRSEVALLDSSGSVEESTEFAPDQILRYGIKTAAGNAVETSFHAGSVQVRIPADRISAWAASDEVGIYADAGGMQVSIEKDFRCLTRPEEKWDTDVYPNPEECHAGRDL